jgi:hypothetical protein
MVPDTRDRRLSCWRHCKYPMIVSEIATQLVWQASQGPCSLHDYDTSMIKTGVSVTLVARVTARLLQLRLQIVAMLDAFRSTSASSVLKSISQVSGLPGNRTVTSWMSQPFPSGSSNETYEA